MTSRGPESSAESLDEMARSRVVVGVEDPRAAATIRRALDADHALVECADAAAVLDGAAAKPPPALILIDAAKSSFDTWEVCRALQRDRELRKIPVIVLIDRKQWRVQSPKAFEVGAADHLRRPFDEVTLRARVALHLELRRLRDLVGAAQALDPATNVAEQRGVESTIDREWRRAAREATPLSLALVRVDDLQGIREERGASYADECLGRIALEIAAIIRRPMDFLGRWEDDGFAVVLPATEPSGASYLAELMRQGVETLTILHPRPRGSGFVTLSLGVTTAVPFPESSPERFVAAARRGVERASLRGGNLVVVVEPE